MNYINALYKCSIYKYSMHTSSSYILIHTYILELYTHTYIHVIYTYIQTSVHTHTYIHPRAIYTHIYIHPRAVYTHRYIHHVVAAYAYTHIGIYILLRKVHTAIGLVYRSLIICLF